MARGIEGNEIGTKRSTPAQKPSLPTQSCQKSQKTLLGFFKKQASTDSSTLAASGSSPITTPATPQGRPTPDAALTPAPSSDPMSSSSPAQSSRTTSSAKDQHQNGLPSPISPTEGASADAFSEGSIKGQDSPSRKVRPSCEPYPTLGPPDPDPCLSQFHQPRRTRTHNQADLETICRQRRMSATLSLRVTPAMKFSDPFQPIQI